LWLVSEFVVALVVIFCNGWLLVVCGTYVAVLLVARVASIGLFDSVWMLEWKEGNAQYFMSRVLGMSETLLGYRAWYIHCDKTRVFHRVVWLLCYDKREI
jgi:hypothetical protein